jgi:hypothetical protein
MKGSLTSGEEAPYTSKEKGENSRIILMEL